MPPFKNPLRRIDSSVCYRPHKQCVSSLLSTSCNAWAHTAPRLCFAHTCPSMLTLRLLSCPSRCLLQAHSLVPGAPSHGRTALLQSTASACTCQRSSRTRITTRARATSSTSMTRRSTKQAVQRHRRTKYKYDNKRCKSGSMCKCVPEMQCKGCRAGEGGLHAVSAVDAQYSRLRAGFGLFACKGGFRPHIFRVVAGLLL